MSRRPAPPPELQGFRHVELLGSGGFSDVHKYVQLGLDRHVAVKVLLGGVDGADEASFQAEANVMARLSNHPSIVTIYAANVTSDGRAFLVMEYCPPPHLGQRLRSRPLSVAKALEIAVQLAGAVETAHRLEILHRDIKPANILFTEFGRPALTDFGISVTTASGASGHGVGMSIAWAPPEQLSAGSPMGPAGDVYSLAATLYASLAGQSPFHVAGGGNGAVELAQRVRSQDVPPTRREDVPESLERILRVAMAKSPSLRYPSVLDFARALQSVQVELHQSVTPIDVRDDRLAADDLDDEGDGGTRVTGFVSVDPYGFRDVARAAPDVRESTPPRADDVDVTSSPAGEAAAVRLDAGPSTDMTAPGRGAAHQPVAAGSTASLSTTRPIPSRFAAATAAGVAAVVALGVTLAQVFGGDSIAGTTNPDSRPERAEQPADPIQEGVPAPDKLVVRKTPEGKLVATWVNPDPQVGDEFAVRLLDPVDPRDWVYTQELQATLDSAPGRQCVQVALVREDGQSSKQPAQACPGGAKG